MEADARALEVKDLIGIYKAGSNEANMRATELALAHRCATNEHPVENVLLSTTSTIEHSGHYRAVLDIARELKGLGKQVVLVVIEQPSEAVTKEFEVVVEPKVRVIKDQAAYRELIGVWQGIIERYDIDAVVLNQYLAATKIWHLLAIRFAQESLGRPYIPVFVKVHNVFTRMEDQGKEYLAHNARGFACFDGVIAANTIDAVFWNTYNPAVFVRPLTVDASLDGYQSKVSSHDVVYLANLNSTKAQLEAIKAIEIVRKEVPDARLVLAGDNTGPYDSYYRSCLRYIENADSNLSDGVVFAGWLSGEEKAKLVESCSLMVSTSRHEGFAISLFEGKLLGLPLVVYDLPNSEACSGGEAVGAINVIDKKPAALASQITRVFKDPQLHRQLSENARAHALEILGFDYGAFWERCFTLDSDCIEVTADMQDAIYRVFYNSISLQKNYHKKKAPQKKADSSTATTASSGPEMKGVVVPKALRKTTLYKQARKVKRALEKRG